MANRPTIEQKQAMLDMLDTCDTEAWTATVKYCARELESEQQLLAEIICRRAEIDAKQGGNGHHPADHIASVLRLAGLQIVIAPEAASDHSI
jgi:hypothetical protein